MSELSQTNKYRQKKLIEVSELTIKTGNARSFILDNRDFIDTVIPSDFITLFDTLIQDGHDIEELKTCANKVLNIFYQPIKNYNSLKPKSNSFLALLEDNSTEMEKILDEIGPLFSAFNKDINNKQLTGELSVLFERLYIFSQHYVIKENVLFPIIEQSVKDYRCLQIMWSFHDDIKRNIKSIINDLENGITDGKQFNRWVGDVFFNMLAIKFREEKILFPYILSVIPEERLSKMTEESMDIGFPFVQPKIEAIKQNDDVSIDNITVNLGTGTLTPQQIKLIFNHLPVDITYVDENDTVQYFSTPKHRIFPRTTAILGRQVSNCHPPESVHIVELIVESFKSGEKDHADFWIKMMGKYIMIQYFAVRDTDNNFKGVIEVSQEITDIKAIEGEKRLLDW